MKRLVLIIVAFATLAAGQTSTAARQQRVLRIGVRSDVRFILTDPNGRSAGFDRNTGMATTQIPLSTPKETCSKMNSNSSTAEPCFREIEIDNPAIGEYRMTVIATQGGSYGLYWSDETTAHLSGRRSPQLPIGTGESQVYAFTCAANPAEDSMRGDFTGAQAVGVADNFLTWGRPNSASVKLPSGSNNYDVIIVYGATIDPASFRAQLNGNNISSLFHPAQQQIEPVRLPLQPGQNILKVTVNGKISWRNAVDTDTLDFTVR